MLCRILLNGITHIRAYNIMYIGINFMKSSYKTKGTLNISSNHGINHLIISFPLVSVVVGVVAITDVVVVIVVFVVDDVVVSLPWYFLGRFVTAQNTWLIIMYLLLCYLGMTKQNIKQFYMQCSYIRYY